MSMKNLIKKYCTHQQKSVQICLLGASTRLGTLTSFLLKQNPLVSGLHLQGCFPIDNVGADLNFMDTRCRVFTYCGMEQSVAKAMKSADIVLVLPSEILKPDTPIGERVMKEGKRLYNIASQCSIYAPRAVIVVNVPPISVSTALVTEVMKKTNFYHPGRIIGSAAIAQDKLLTKLEENEPELATCQEEECVICIQAKATMQTSPCGHQVVCRKCFVKTIQIAVAQRLLPLRCVICRAKVLRLKTGFVQLPSSASGYSMTSSTSVPQSDSLYSVSSGGSSILSSSASCVSDNKPKQHEHGQGCHCVGGAYPRQPTSGAIRRSQKQDMKMTLKDYCRPEKNRLPPIREASPLHTAPPASTRIRCAQKIITQLEMPVLMRKSVKYERLAQQEDQEPSEKPRKWWSDREKIDNEKNEMKEKFRLIKN